MESLGIWAPLIFIPVYAIAAVFIPTTPLMLISGFMFGFVEGIVYTMIAGLISAVSVFYLSRRLGKDGVEKLLQHKHFSKLSSYNKRLEKGGMWDLVLLRITPIMPFNALNVLMGISDISYQNYILGTALGLLPSKILTTYLGSLISHLF